MKKIRDLSIKIKLLSGFMLLAVLLAFSGIIGYVGMENITANGETMYSYNLQSIDELHNIKENLLEIRGQILVGVLHGDADKTKEAASAMETFFTNTSTLSESYNNRPLSDAGREI